MRIQLRSQALRRASALGDPMVGFGLLPDIKVTEANMGEDGRTAWRQSDLTRVIRAAEKADLRAYRIEVSPDGTISIVVGASAAPPCDAPPRAETHSLPAKI